MKYCKNILKPVNLILASAFAIAGIFSFSFLSAQTPYFTAKEYESRLEETKRELIPCILPGKRYDLSDISAEYKTEDLILKSAELKMPIYCFSSPSNDIKRLPEFISADFLKNDILYEDLISNCFPEENNDLSSYCSGKEETDGKENKSEELPEEKNYIESEVICTAYCSCTDCSGIYGNNTSTGVLAKAERTIAVDPSVIPYGTEVEIDGRIYVAEDCGGAIKGNKIDIYFDTHEETERFGVQKKTVKIYTANDD